ncbi:phage antirepressor Ant [Acetobacterium paludosum]|uniref:Phage antirepressor Ant n=1 Tax=Acetobacterium paludosum TaxID=52693 RepID=A0A923HYG8_9FIRM|nr:phage antirepressor KilAC domain-containing protein [Acetobacterium paludosum]MBC3889467.1 phage antirepressor Ant [Acetobacterium paludosum]
MNDLIKTHENENGELEVIGRELHEFLEVKDNYTDWFKRMACYGFAEGQDFIGKIRESTGGRPGTDHRMTITMAKELCMLQRTDKGKQARQYFLQLEQAWNTPEMVMARAIKISARVIEEKDNVIKLQEKQIEELKPLAAYVRTILNNKSLVTVEQIAQDYGMSAQKLNKMLHSLHIQYRGGNGQWILYQQHKPFGYVHSETISFKRSDGRPDSTMHTKWTQEGRMFLYKKLKENGILPLIERDFEEKAI